MTCFVFANILFWVILVLLVFKLYIKTTTAWCKSNVCLIGKTAIVTGANTGIGYETAADFAKRGAKVILACRDPTRGNNAAERIINETDNPNIFFKQLNLCSFKSVRQFVDDVRKSEVRLDILVNNAGASIIAPSKTEDGLLELMQTNYFGAFLLTNLLLDLLKKTPNSRIINVSSIIAQGYGNLDVNNLNEHPKGILAHLKIYSKSKLCNILFNIELANRLKGTSVTAYSLHPGIILTGIWRGIPIGLRQLWEQMISLLFKNSLEGAQTTIYCSVAKNIEHLSGQHFQDCHVMNMYKSARDPELPKKLWTVSEKLVRLN